MISDNEIDRRVEKAQGYFKQGFNCAQSVVAACADIYGIDNEELALKIGAGFGGGIGRMRLTCGAVCGMVLLEGMNSGCCIAGDMEGKGANYARVQHLLEAFRQEHGAISCAELTALKADGPKPEARTAEYYRKRPCVEIVGNTTRIFLKSLNEQEDNK
ncbi:MAG: C-GCAxxG-C-C family protein [Paludibacteraceae bacterium]|nr:C-GCAxxG-C-C family protein [Paludibacteraceae bacterium]